MALPEYRPTARVETGGVVAADRSGIAALGAAAEVGDALSRLGIGMRNKERRDRLIAAELRGRSLGGQIDANGRLVYQPPKDLSNEENLAEARAASTGYMAQFALQQARAIAEMRIKYADDPAGFDAVAQAHSAGALGQVPELFRPEASEVVGRLVTETYTGLLNRRADLDRSLASDAFTAQLGAIEKDLASLAATGGTATPAYRERAGEFTKRLRDGVAAGFISEERAQIIRDQVANEGIFQHLASQALGIYDRAGGGARGERAALEHLDRLLGDPELKLPVAEREAIVDRLEERIRERSAWRGVAAGEIRDEFDRLKTRLDLGYEVPTNDLYRLADGAAQAGNYGLAREIADIAVLQGDLKSFAKLPLAEQEARVRAADEAARAAGTGGFDAAIAFVLKEEGGYVADDAGRGPSNFGINRDANPDIDVAGLTEDRAREIYRDRYWQAIGGDQLPADVALVAFDAAVNQGVSVARQLLEDYGNDAAGMIEARRDLYVELASSEKYAPYLDTWNGRLDRLSEAVSKVDPEGVLSAKRARTFAEAYAAKAKALETDAFAYGMEIHKDAIGPVAPVDFGQPDQIAEQLAPRLKSADYIASYEGVDVIPMTKGELAQAARALSAADAGQASQIFAELTDGLGGYFMPAMVEMAALGLPDAMAKFAPVIAKAGAPEQTMFRQKLIEGAKLGREELVKALSPETVSDVTDAVDGEMADLLGTWSKVQASVYRQAVEIAALTMAREGQASAAARAAAGALTNAYEVHDGYRVPTAYDGGRVAVGLEAIQQRIARYDLDPGGSRFAPTTTAQQRKADMVAEIKRGATWQTLADDSGVVLIEPDGFPAMVKKNGRSVPLVITWEAALAERPPRYTRGGAVY